jgi:TetR/AcrR family transcriptional regulator
MADNTTAVLGLRGARTRQAILDASRRLFLDRGYAGTRINNITDACGISRAGFYTYFKDKREVFTLLGESAYRDVLEVVGQWDMLPRPCGLDDVARWVRTYFAFMDVHGAFIFASGQSAPDNEQVRANSKRMQMRVAFLLGVHLRARQARPTDAPETLGLPVMAMLDRSWYYCRGQDLPADENDVVRTVAQLILTTQAK